jgi:hypothetical protein
MSDLIQAIIAFAVEHESTINKLNIVVTSMIVIILGAREILRVFKDQSVDRWGGVINKTVLVLLALFAILILAKLANLFALAGQG